MLSGDDSYLIDHTITVAICGDYSTEDLRHPGAENAGPGGQPCQPDTTGLLRPLRYV